MPSLYFYGSTHEDEFLLAVRSYDNETFIVATKDTSVSISIEFFINPGLDIIGPVRGLAV